MNRHVILLLGILVLAVVGCAQRSAYVVARHQPGLDVSKSSKIALIAPASPQQRSEQVYRAALTALNTGGFRLVTPAEADYQLIVLLDKNTHTVTGPAPVDYVGSSAAVVPSGSVYYGVSTPMGYAPQSVEEVHESGGIRLSLYPTRAVKPAQIRTAWDGYVDSGRTEVSPEHDHALLRTLLRYFGQDFIGRAKLAE